MNWPKLTLEYCLIIRHCTFRHFENKISQTSLAFSPSIGPLRMLLFLEKKKRDVWERGRSRYITGSRWFQPLLNQLSVEQKLCGGFKTIPVNIQYIPKAKYITIHNRTPPPPLPSSHSSSHRCCDHSSREICQVSLKEVA